MLDDAVEGDEGRGRQQVADEAERGTLVFEPPEDPEVADDHPRPEQARRAERVPARERRGGERGEHRRQHHVERGAPDDGRSLPARDDGQHGERADPELHAGRRQRDGPRRPDEAGVGRPPEPRCGHARYTPRRVSITLAVSDRIFRSSQIERLYMYARSYLSLVVGEVWYSPFTCA